MSKYLKVKFGDFVEHISREVELDVIKEYPSVGVKWYGEGVHVYEVKDGGSFNASRFEIKESDIIYNDMWARKGSVAVVPYELDGAVASSHFPTFLPDLSRVMPKYLEYYFRTPSFWEDCENASRGSTGRNQIKKSTFYAIEIPLPPLDEQRRIVARIEALAGRIADAQSLRRSAAEEGKQLLASRSLEIFSQVKQNYLTKSFRSFSPHVTSGPRYWRDRYSDGGYRFYRAQDIGPTGNIQHDNKIYVTPPVSDQGKTALLEVGDLMIVITGATVGRVSVFTNDLEPGYVSQHVSICRLPQDKILPRYALWWLLSPEGQSQLLEQRYGQGKPGLNLTNIRSIVIPVLPPDEQRRIVTYLDGLSERVNELRRLQAESQVELNALLPSVLDRAFKGEL